MHHDSATLLLALQRLLSDLSERAIHLDPVAAKNFASLAGQVIEIHCLEPALTWHLNLQESSIEVHAGPQGVENRMRYDVAHGGIALVAEGARDRLELVRRQPTRLPLRGAHSRM